MKYIKKLNIDFNNWDEIEYIDKFLIFKSGKYYYIGYIIDDYDNYKLVLYDNEKHTNKYTVDVINNIVNINPHDKVNYNLNDSVEFVNLDRNKIIVVGIDCNRRELLSNIDKYVIEHKKYDIDDILKNS